MLLSTETLLPLLFATQIFPDVSSASADGPLDPPVLYPVDGDSAAPFALSLLTVGPLLTTHTLPEPSKASASGP